MPTWAKHVYRRFFEQLQPSHKVAERIASIKLPENYISVQIRASKSKGDTLGVVSLETYFNEMDKYTPETQFFISCLNKEVSDAVHERYGNRILELPNKQYTSMVDAVADMWYIGRGKELICQNRSSFAEVSWWWGGAQSKVNRLDVEFVQNR